MILVYSWHNNDDIRGGIVCMLITMASPFLHYACRLQTQLHLIIQLSTDKLRFRLAHKDPKVICTDMMHFVRIWLIPVKYTWESILTKTTAELYVGSSSIRPKHHKEKDIRDVGSGLKPAAQPMRYIQCFDVRVCSSLSPSWYLARLDRMLWVKSINAVICTPLCAESKYGCEWCGV